MEYIFETERLRARKFEQKDAARLYENHSDDEVKKWIPGECYEDIDDARDAAAFYAGRAQQRALPCVLAAELKATGELIGDTGINAVEGRPDEVEIGYVIGREYRGKGYATELLGAMTEYAAAAFGTCVVYGRVMRGNDASVRVLDKNGYVFVREEHGAEDDPHGNGMLVYMKKAEP